MTKPSNKDGVKTLSIKEGFLSQSVPMRVALSLLAAMALVTPVILVGSLFSSLNEPSGAVQGESPDDVFRIQMERDTSFTADEIKRSEDVAEYACELLDEGMDFATLISISVTAGANQDMDARDVGIIIGSGIVAYCPEYQGAAEDYVNGR